MRYNFNGNNIACHIHTNMRNRIVSQDPSKIAHQYDSVAKEYAEAFTGEHKKKPKDREVLLKFSKEIGGRRPVWDFGCGPGQTSRYLKDLGIEISGLDYSEKLLERARTINREICFQRGNILELKFEDDSIAGIVAFYAIVHFTEEQVLRAFREIFRVLQPDGIFLFTYHIGDGAIHLNEFLGIEVDIDFMFFKTESISRYLKEVGFQGIEVIERDPYPKVEHQSRRAYVFTRKPKCQKCL